jgi:hypothetical protein
VRCFKRCKDCKDVVMLAVLLRDGLPEGFKDALAHPEKP